MPVNIERTVKDAVCSRCKQNCKRTLEQMKYCDLVKSHISTHRNREVVSVAVSVGIIDTSQIKRRGNHDVMILSNPNRKELTRVLSSICQRYHDRLMPCSGCPIDQALQDLNISMDTFGIFYAPYFPITCRCHRND